MSRTNTVIAICSTVIVGLTIACVTVLLVLGKDADAFTRIVNTFLNAAGVLISSGAFLYARVAAKESDLTNNSFHRKTRAALREHDRETSGGE